MDERVAALNAIGFEWETVTTYRPNGELWNERLRDLREYKKANGHCNVPQRQGPLGRWVTEQRSLYKKRGGGAQTPLTDERVAALDALDFQWKLR